LKYPEDYLRKIDFNENVVEYSNGLYFKDKNEFYDLKKNKKELKKLAKGKMVLFSKAPFIGKVYDIKE
jgi:hypothetical protein